MVDLMRTEGTIDWSWIDYDVAGSITEVERAVDRVADLVRAIPDPSVRCADLDWTCGETAAHLAGGLDANALFLQGRSDLALDIDRMAASQVELIGTIPERDSATLADHVLRSGAALVEAIRTADPLAALPYHGGMTQPAGGVPGMVLGELLLHGLDLAATDGRPWPVADAPCAHVTRGTFGILQHFMRPEVIRERPCTYDVRVAGVARACFTFADERLTVTPAPTGKVDCHLAIRPAAFVLSLYGRRTPISQVLRGRAIAWGRSPFAAFRLRGYANEEI